MQLVTPERLTKVAAKVPVRKFEALCIKKPQNDARQHAGAPHPDERLVRSRTNVPHPDEKLVRPHANAPHDSKSLLFLSNKP